MKGVQNGRSFPTIMFYRIEKALRFTGESVHFSSRSHR